MCVTFSAFCLRHCVRACVHVCVCERESCELTHGLDYCKFGKLREDFISAKIREIKTFVEMAKSLCRLLI